MARSRTIEGLILAFTVAVAPDIAAQYVTVVDGLGGVVRTWTPDLIELPPIPVGLDPRTMASDGSGRVWVCARVARKIFVCDVAGGVIVNVIDLARSPFGIALDADGNALVVQRGTVPGDDRLQRITEAGVVLSDWPIMSLPDQIAIDRLGVAWVTHTLPNFTSQVVRYGTDGSVLGIHPIGIGVGSFAVDPRGYVAAQSSSSPEFYYYTEDGDLAALWTVGTGAVSLALDAQGRFLRTLPGAHAVEVVETTGSADPLWVGGLPEAIGVDGKGRIFAADRSVRRVRVFNPGLVETDHLVFDAFYYLPGDITGRGYVSGAGAERDADGDGYRNGEEIRLGSDPFDASEVPLTLRRLADGNGQALDALELCSVGTPGAVYWVAMAFTPNVRGAGAFGFALSHDGLFALTSTGVGGVLWPTFSALDGTGRAVVSWSVPDGVVLTPTVVAAAFQVFPGFPSDLGATPSSAFVFEIP